MNAECKKYEKPDEDNLGFLLWRIMRLWQRERQKDLEEFQVTVSQLEILGGIYYLNTLMDEVTQITLSQETGIDPMTTSTVIRNLEKKGLVKRKLSKTDTRARAVIVSLSGEQLLMKAVAKMRRAESDLLRSINNDFLVNELKKLLEQLKKQKKVFNDHKI